MNENINIKGIFQLKIFDAKTGVLLEDYEDRNLVVNGGRTAVTRMLGGDFTNRNITKIAVGTNSTAPTATDTAITGAFTKALGTISYPTISSVKGEWSLETSEDKGIGIREFGLLCQNDTLFARKTREVINKTSAIRLVGTWEILF